MSHQNIKLVGDWSWSEWPCSGRVVLILLGAALAVPGQIAANEATDAPPDYVANIAPLLKTYCVGCHNANTREGGLSLESYSDLQQGGKHGPVIVNQQPKASRLLRVLLGDVEPRMPPEGELQPAHEEIELLRTWIEAGAKGPGGVEPDRKILLVPKITPAAAELQPVTALAYSPDGKMLAVGRFGAVELLTVEPRKVVTRLTGLPGKVTDVCFTPNGQQLVVASGTTGLTGEVVVWDVQTAEKIRAFQGHRDLIQAADISPDGKLLVTGSYDHTAMIWELATGENLQTLQGHNQAIYDVAFSPAGDVVATASGDATIKLWNVATGQRLDTLSQPLKEQYTVTFTPDGQSILGGGADNRLRMWQFVSRNAPQINPLVHARFAHNAAVAKIAMSPDGQRAISVGDDRVLKLWAMDDFTEQFSYNVQPDRIAAMAIAPGGHEFVVGRFDGTLDSLDLVEKDVEKDTANSTSTTAIKTQPAASGPIENLTELEPNDEPTTAMPLGGATKITGLIERAKGQPTPDVDLFRFHARAGDQWIVETRAQRLKSPLDTYVEILDSDGNPIVQTVLQAVRDSYLTFRPVNSKTNATIRLHNWEEMTVNQYLYIGGEVLRLHTYPRGPDSGFDVYGNTNARYTYFNTTPFSHPLHTPCFIVEELPPGATVIPSGLPVFELYYANDDDPRRKIGTDSRLVFTAPAEGEYLIRLRDARRWDGPDYKYELKLRTPKPDFHVRLDGVNPKIHRGSGKAFLFKADRIDGFDGPIRIDVANLPPGFSVNSPLVIQAGQEEARAVINAAFDAPDPTESQAKATRVIATAEVDGQDVIKSVNNLGEIKLEAEAPKVLARLLPVANDQEPDTNKETDTGQEPATDQISDAKKQGVTPAATQAEAADSRQDPFEGIPGPVEFTIHPGETIAARLSVKRVDYDGAIEFGKEGAGHNLPHGVYVDNIGLSGIVVVPGSSERTVFITADHWVAEQSRSFFLVTKDAGEHATWPAILHVRQR